VGGLQKLEHRLEQMISGAFARAFRSAVQPVEISAALQRECDNNAQIMSRDRRLVPNRFLVQLAGVDLERLHGYDDAMERELVDQLKDHADTQGYVFTGPVQIDFESADDLTTGRFRILSRAEASVTDNDQRTRTRAARAVLEVNGTRHPLRAPGLVVGRGTEADLRINDPGVSRRHVEFVVAGEDLEVVDLGSTNGMLVDGTKVGRAGLRDGTQVKIGHTTMTVRVSEES
jgi:hypothetical protein